MSEHGDQAAKDVGADENTRKSGTTPQPATHQPSASTDRTQPRRLSSAQSTRVPSTPHGEASDGMGPMSPELADRVYPIRSVVSVDPNPTPIPRSDRYQNLDYFQTARASSRRPSEVPATMAQRSRETSREQPRRASGGDTPLSPAEPTTSGRRQSRPPQPDKLPAQILSDIVSQRSADSEKSGTGPHGVGPGEGPQSAEAASSVRSVRSAADENQLITARFKHVVTDGGHAVITGRDGETLQRCEDEPIHIPGAVQSFGLLIALQEEQGTGNLLVRIVSENSKRIIGRTPKQLFELESFTEILSEEQADNLLDHLDFVREEDVDVGTNGPEVFTMSVKPPKGRSRKLWCAMHINERNPTLVICEFELEDDPENPLVQPNAHTPELPEDTLQSHPTEEEYNESTVVESRPLRVLRTARKRKGEAAAMEVFNIMSQVQEQLANAPNLDRFLKILIGVVKELTGFHRVMIYQFDQAWNGRVVSELVDPRATKDLFKGLNFPASDIPKQARELYKINKVRLLYDRDQETSRLVCRTVEDLETPLDLTYAYLRAMSPIHLKYLSHMAVRSSMSISINAFNELWGLIACHSYGNKGMRVSFPIRKMCRLVGDTASRNIERLSYASRLQARKLINTVPTQHNPSGYIIASSDDLLKLFDADFGLLSIRGETKILGHFEDSQEALAMLEYLRMRKITSVTTSQDIQQDFPDLRYSPGFSVIAGLLLVPLSVGGEDFIVFFRKGQLREVKWAGNPYEKFIREGTEGYLEPRKSFKTWSETVLGKSREWTEEEIETAAVLCLVYGKFIEVWRQKEAALQNSQLTRLLLANSAHEVRTPLNAIINYLEIALEGSLDQETRENLAKSHSASKSLIYVINDLLDLTKTEEGVDLIKDEVFDLKATLREATDMFTGDARRKGISYEVIEYPDVPQNVLGDQRRVRQAISNITANAIQNTTTGGVVVELYVSAWEDQYVHVEVSVQDTGVGMNSQKLDELFRDLEQVQSEHKDGVEDNILTDVKTVTDGEEKKRTLGLGLAVVARIVRNMNGQLRLKSEEGKGSRFTLQFPLEVHEQQGRPKSVDSGGSVAPYAEGKDDGEVTLVDKEKESVEVTPRKASRRNSSDSISSKKSLRSFNSGSTNRSGMSDVDRLIEAIQEPHRVEARPRLTARTASSRSIKGGASRPATGSLPSSPQHTRSRGLEEDPFNPSGPVVVPEHLRMMDKSEQGEEPVPFSAQPVKAVKVPEEGNSAPPSRTGSVRSGSITGEVVENPGRMIDSSSPEHMHVLVAEDDPVNSKIVKKRLEKIGHRICLTVNGEDCASTYGDQPGTFDVVLMDMQMPIVDGLSSTKMIRSHEKTHATAELLSARASKNGRIPIIAVSASLVERDRQQYIDAGFDGWILKPISFARLSELMAGIVDSSKRKAAVYTPGDWEKGGWFSASGVSAFESDTAPSGGVPTSLGGEKLKAVADTKSEDVGDGVQDEEQRRLRAVQERGEAEAPPPSQQPQPHREEEGAGKSRKGKERATEADPSGTENVPAEVESGGQEEVQPGEFATERRAPQTPERKTS